MSDEPKVLLTLEEGDIIVCKRFGYLGDNLIGVIAGCDDGSERLFAVDAEPTNAQFYDFKLAADASYEEKLKAIESVLEDIEDRGGDVPDTSTLELIDAWLNAKKELEEDYELEEWGSKVSPYAPGFAIEEALTAEEAKALGLRQQDMGGPASSVPCVSTTASLDELNRILAAKKLPFVFIDDEGPEDWH
jgi:hypothetical protein